MLSTDPTLPLDFSYTHSVVDLFQRQVRQFPGSVALHDDLGTWAFRGVDEVSDAVCRQLADRGARPGSVVAIYADRCAALVQACSGSGRPGRQP